MLKQHPSAQSDLPSPASPWVVLAPEGEPATIVRFVVADRSVSFPYHGLTRWEFTPGNSDCLAIRFDDEIVTLQGHGLAALRDALDGGRLLAVQVRPGRAPVSATGGTVVTAITFAPVKPTSERSAGVQD